MIVSDAVQKIDRYRREVPCQLGVGPFFQCCCNCKLRLTDYKHCTIHGRGADGCCCHEVKGYVCIAFASEGIVHSEWPEHSCGCELYSPRRLP